MKRVSKIILCLTSAMLITCSFLFVKPKKVRAEGCSTEIVTNQNSGYQYCMPESIYYNGSENDKSIYRNMIRTGNIGSGDHQWLERYILDKSNIRNQKAKGNLTWDSYLNLAKTYLDGVFNGNITRINLNTLQYWLGTMRGDYSTHSFQSDISSMQESSYKNYYTGNNGTVYNTGDTIYNTIYNNDNQKFYNITNNTYYNIRDYNYNFETNYYTYNIDNTQYITVYNDNTKSNITIFNNGVQNSYSMYYKLPDGSNSYNMNVDDVKGLRTDFNIRNYQSLEDGNVVASFFHFDGDNNPDSYWQTNLLEMIPSSVDYVDSKLNFGQALLFNQNDISIKWKNSRAYYSFLFKPIFNEHFKLKIHTPMGDFIAEANKVDNITNTLQTVNGSSQAVVVYEKHGNTGSVATQQVSSLSTSNFPSVAACGTSEQQLSYYFTITEQELKESTNNGNYYYIWGYNTRVCKLVQNVNTTNQQVIVNKTENLVLDQYASHINMNAWNYLELSRDSDSYYNVYINGNKVYTFPSVTTSNRWLELEIEQDGSFLFDELHVFNTENINYDFDHTPPNYPLTSNTSYVLPNNLSTNNTILIKSRINVNGFQIGGYRPVIANDGFVYVSVDDFGYLTSLQQYKNNQWVDVDGALFNNVLNKWVNYKGFSIYLNNFDYQEAQDITIYSVSDNQSFLKWFQQELNRIMESINNLNPNYNIVNNISTENDIDTNLENKYNISTENSLNLYIDDLIDLGDGINLDVPEMNLDPDHKTGIENLSQLIPETFNTFESNDIGYFIWLPIIIMILGVIL